MYIRRRKSFFGLLALLRHIEADKDDIAAVARCNQLILREILHAEAALLRHRASQRELTRMLKTSRSAKAEAKALRTRLKRAAGHVSAQEDAIFIWKCFGDALAFLYLDKFSIKHAFFEVDKWGIKRGAGMLTGKSGLAGELACLAHLTADGIPAVLCDITNILRYGDICMLGASDPHLIEVKSSNHLNQRAKRQVEKLGRLHDFMADDRAEPFRGAEGLVVRAQLDIPERTNVDALNACIANAKAAGQAIANPEPGVTFVAIYDRANYDAIFSGPAANAKLVFMLNSDKNDHAWAPYTPFLLTIHDPQHVLDFIEGRLYLIALIDTQPLCDAMADDEWAVRFKDDPNYSIQCVHRPSGAYLAVSNQFLSRAAYEFVSLAWIAESQRPSIARMEAAIGDAPIPQQIAGHQARLRAFVGEGDPWLEELGLA
ncbi:MAG: hypothetical protein KF730_17320 [Sphingomonas sp.]|uniref:hypothetical protein n=1 Tax=Sphingomonas sp. TaxID=28214 RepID=UPI0025FFF6DE|nr:hypothetical protein [Sphingomonas sp.]MBX3566323.1 hypothetical protein [Sphingomonas sp.]